MPNKFVALITDLIFATKVRSTAEAVGIEVDIVRTTTALQDGLRTAGPAACAIIDLNASGIDVAVAIRAAREVGCSRVVAYLSHVQADMARAARDAGADEVIPRSEFSSRLPQILAGEA